MLCLICIMLASIIMYPYMTYWIEVWGCASQTQLNYLFLLQKKILRIMRFSYYLAHTNPLFLSMEVLSLRKIFFYKFGLIIYKYSNNFCTRMHSTICKMIVSMSKILEDVIYSKYSQVQ